MSKKIPLEERVMRRLKLRELRILMTVVHAGSMGKAAAELALSQPAVSKAIAEMEYTLGVALLDRTPQGVEPTLYGRVLLKWAVAAFDDLSPGGAGDRVFGRSCGRRGEGREPRGDERWAAPGSDR
jgi:DNA-binding transcriptional LysR family regulator